MIHWKILNNYDGYYHIISPTMAMNDEKMFELFGEKKALYKGLKDIENQLKSLNALGWFSDTSTLKPHIMRLFTKIGAIPYRIVTDKNPSKDRIWFKKSLTGA
jgi:hypothetical protein